VIQSIFIYLYKLSRPVAFFKDYPIGMYRTPVSKSFARAAELGKENADGTALDEMDCIFTSIPPRRSSESSKSDAVPGGWAECMLSPTMKDFAIAKAFPTAKELPKIPHKSYEMKQCPGNKGLGMFATRDIGQYDLIMCERPIIVFPQGLRIRFLPLAETFGMFESRLDWQEMIAHRQMEERLTIAFNRMTAENRKAYMDLADCHTHYDAGGPISGIFRTNALHMPSFTDENQGQDGIYSGVAPQISRVNHRYVYGSSLPFHP
jgi:hypothetical protein